MFVKLFMLAIVLFGQAYEIITGWISDRQDKKPLPKEVQGIYEPERYKSYLNQKRDYRRLSYIRMPISLALESLFLFTPFYNWMEQIAAGRIYIILLITVLISFFIGELIDLPFSYYETFVIEEKYGLNKSTKKEFFKDTVISTLTTLITVLAVAMAFGLICQWLGEIAATIEIGYSIAMLISIGILVIAFALIFILNVISLVSMRLQYKFTDLTEGELRTKILKLTEDSKKKLRRITVYNESAKSTSKNAFLLRFLGYREFSIADNFMDENSERELLAVLAHEAGHLKYKKRVLDYLSYIPTILLLMFFVWAICNSGIFLDFAKLVRQSFGLQCTNYYLLLEIVLSVARPVLFVLGVFSKYRARKQEYNADANAVSHGYGQELKETFVKLSSDELIDVNPSPVIEFLEYSHPGMYNRIRAINEGIEKYPGETG